MTKITTTTTVKAEVKIKASVQRKLLTELRAYGELASQKKVIQHAMDGHRERVLVIGDAEVGEKKFEIEGYKVALVTDAMDCRLDKVKLVKALVASGHYSVEAAQALLEGATTSKPKKAYAKITSPGEKDENY